MAIDRQGTGLAILRILIGVFFFFEGLGKIRWFTNTSILAARFAEWSQAAPAGSMAHWYLERVAVPFAAVIFGCAIGALAVQLAMPHRVAIGGRDHLR